MPVFQVTIQRQYTITEGFDRFIEADSAEEAQAAAERLAEASDNDVPDDCAEIESAGCETGDFHINAEYGLLLARPERGDIVVKASEV